MADDARLPREEAVRVVAASVRSLFSFISDQQATDLASAVLNDLEGRGLYLARDRAPSGE